jgi:ssDNA-binding Zn-finger/Zn-ribbon topoisomerase 1
VKLGTGERCEKCEGFLIERTNSQTKNTFLGCSEWPDCKYTKNGGSNPSPERSYISTWEDDCYEDGDYPGIGLFDWDKGDF